METTAQPTKINIDDFVTGFDARMKPGYAQEQHAHGAQLAKDGYEMHVSNRGTWSAARNGTDHVQAFERIGYHSCTKDLLQGFLEAGGKCTFHNFRGIDGIVTL